MEIQKKTRKFQDGGAAPAQQAPQQGAPAEQPTGGAQDPMAQLLQAAAQASQTKDCQTALAVCDALVQLAQGQGGEAPAEQPTYQKQGGKLVRVKK